MAKKQFFVMMASHKPSAITLQCEIQSMISSLKKHDGLDVEGISIDSMNRVVFSLDQEVSNPTVPEVSFSQEHMTIECKNFGGSKHNEMLKALHEILRHSGRILTNFKEHSSIDKVSLDNGTFRIAFKVNASSALPKSEVPNETLLLIDGPNLLSRAYFATSFRGDLLTNQEGLYTNGVYVFVKKFLRLIERFRTTHVVVCWDVSRSETFRRQIYPEYKGLRGDTEPELKQQFETTETMLRMMNVPQLRVLPYEADDLIGTLSAKWKANKGGKCVVYSNDKDLFQLLDEELQIMQIISRNKEDVLYSSVSFEKEYRIKTSQWIDVKSILGETGKSSDNIPGCHGVGEKAIFPLIQMYKSVNGIYDNLDNFDKSFSRYKKKFEEGKESVELSRKLVTIVRDIEQFRNTNFEEFKLNIDKNGMRKAFDWLGFRNVIS